MDATGTRRSLHACEVHSFVFFFSPTFFTWLCCQVLHVFIHGLCVNFSVRLILIPRGVWVNAINGVLVRFRIYFFYYYFESKKYIDDSTCAPSTKNDRTEVGGGQYNVFYVSRLNGQTKAVYWYPHTLKSDFWQYFRNGWTRFFFVLEGGLNIHKCESI